MRTLNQTQVRRYVHPALDDILRKAVFFPNVELDLSGRDRDEFEDEGGQGSSFTLITCLSEINGKIKKYSKLL